MTEAEIITTLRELIREAAPDPAQAEPVRTCRDDVRLDELIPFSSLIVLGVIVAVEDHYGFRVTRDMLEGAATEGFTLRGLAAMVATVLARQAVPPAEDAL